MLLVKYKTVKQLREVRDPRYLPESLSQKDARHLQVLNFPSAQSLFVDPRERIENYVNHPTPLQFNHPQETTGRLEADFRHLISEVVPAGSNLMLVCAQVDIWMFFNIKQVKGHDLIHIFLRWLQRLSCSRERLCGCPPEVPLSGELTMLCQLQQILISTNKDAVLSAQHLQIQIIFDS